MNADRDFGHSVEQLVRNGETDTMCSSVNCSFLLKKIKHGATTTFPRRPSWAHLAMLKAAMSVLYCESSWTTIAVLLGPPLFGWSQTSHIQRCKLHYYVFTTV